MKAEKPNILLATILSGIFGVFGTYYTSKKGFGTLFIKIFIISAFIVAFNYLIKYFIKSDLLLMTISVIELIVLRTITIFWSLFISKAKNNSEIELTKKQEISIGNSGINFGLSNIIFLILIPIFCGCYAYAILTWTNLVSENFKIGTMLLTIFTTLIISIYLTGKETEKKLL